MTCKRTHYSPSPSVFASVAAVFTLVVSLGAPAAIASTPLFLPAVTYGSGGLYPVSVVVADVNGDDKPDILVANSQSGGTVSGTVSVLLGNGDGTFQTAVSYSPGGSDPTSVAVGDVNGDGSPDLVVAIAGNNTVGVLLGHGDGTFEPAVTFASGGDFPDSVTIADVNTDGRPDIVVVNQFCTAGCTGIGNGSAAVLLGNGDGTFLLAASYDTGRGAISLVVADVNGDSKPDIVVADCGANIFCPTSAPGAVSILLGNGNGTFQATTNYSSGGISALSVAVADVNGDGKLDLLVANSGSGTVGVLLGNGDGTFQSALTYSSGGSIYSQAVVADVNGDGNLDLEVGIYPFTVATLLGNGDGSFQSPLAYNSGGSGPTSVTVEDINGDSKPDVIVTNIFFHTVGVLLNNSQPPDTIPPAITVSATPKKLWPPNGRLVPVTLSGTITDTGSGVNASTAEYAVQDEYGEVQPFGKITLDSAGNCSFTILLRAGRRGNDLNGRQYTTRVSAKDNAGNRGVRWTRVTVPHDQSQ